MADKRDYYEVLGLNKNANADDIKGAYRKAALKWHPDRWVSGTDAEKKTAEDNFKEASEAYSVLSDPEKKQKYDQFGFAGVSGAEGGFNWSGQGFGDLNDILNSFFGGGFSGFGGRSSQQTSRGIKGRDIAVDVRLTLEEIATGCKKEITVNKNCQCHVCGGKGTSDPSSIKTCPTCHGSGQIRQQNFIFTNVNVCPNCNGMGKVVTKPCNNCRGTGLEKISEKITVNIPAGACGGMRIPLRGQGDSGLQGGPNGDLIVNIVEMQHKQLRRDDINLFYTRVINLIDALTGTEIDVPCLDGVTKIKLEPGVQSGTIKRLRGKGIPSVNGYDRGDLYVKILVWIPHKLNKNERAAIEDMRGSDSFKLNPTREDKELFEKEMKFF